MLNRDQERGRHIEWLADDPITWLGQEPARIARVRGLVENTSPAFRAELWRMSERLGLDVDCVAGTISFETGGSFDPAIKNPRSSAIGLIQFLEDTAIGLGTTTAQLRQMTAVQQLYYVERFYERQARRIRSCCDHYLAVFMPDLIGKSPSDVAMQRGDGNYEVNSGFDRDGDGVVYVSDICATHNSIMAAGRAHGYVDVDLSATESSRSGGFWTPVLTGVALGAVGLLAYTARARGVV